MTGKVGVNKPLAGPEWSIVPDPLHGQLALVSPTSASSSISSTSSPRVVFCTPWSFRLAWCSCFLLHLCHGVLVARAAYSQIRTILWPTEVARNLRMLGQTMHVEYTYLAVVVGLLFTTYHAFFLSSLVVHSIRARELVFTGSSRHPLQSLKRRLSLPSRLEQWMDLRNPHFERIFLAKEIYEILWETLQVYRLCYEVTNHGVGYVALFVLVANCWTTPLIYYLHPHPSHTPMRVVLCLGVDALLDFMSSMVVPYVVYVQYRTLVAHANAYDPVWVVLTGNNLYQFVTNRLSDVLARIFPALSMVTNLTTIKTVIRRRRHSPTTPPLPSGSLCSSPSLSHSRWHRFVRGIFILYGLVVIVVVAIGTYTTRQQQRDWPGCHVLLRHSLFAKPRCAVLEVNCQHHTIQGHADELTAILDGTKRQSLSALIISHCPAVTIPTAIHSFPNLVWFELYNSTVTAWPASAVLSATTHPILSRLLIVRTNFTTAPEAMMDTRTQLPRTLLDVTLVATNLPSFEGVLLPHHATMASLIIEQCALTMVPSIVVSVHTEVLSLAGNELVIIPIDLFQNKTYRILSLAANPITALPTTNDSLTITRGLAYDVHGIFLQATRITTSPPLASDCSWAVYAHATPLCDTTALSPSCAVDCTTNVDGAGFLVPLDAIAMRRQPS